MSSTSNAQDLLVNVFRPTYTYDSNTGFTPALVVSNVSELIVGRINTDRLGVADSNGNSYVGCNAGSALADGTTYSNVAIGVSAMAGASNSSNNVSVGLSNFSGLSNANSNVGLGANTLMTGSGQKNVLIGANVTLGTGSGNIVIGNDLALGNLSNTLRLGNILYGNLTAGYIGINNPAPVAALDISGEVLFRNKVGIQKTDPKYTLDVAGSIYATEQIIGGKGTQSNPMYTFIDSSGSGMYVPVDPSYGTGSFGIAVNKKAAAIFSDTAVNFFQNLDVSGTFSARNIDISAFSVTDGTALKPSVTFTNDTSTGLFLVSSNRLGVTTGGVRRMEVLSNGDVSMGKLATRDISLTGTIVGSNPNTVNIIGGVTLSNGNVILTGTATNTNLLVPGWIRNNATTFNLDISGGNISNELTTRSSNFRASAGTAGIPAYSFASDPSTGVHSAGTSQIAFDTSGVQRMVISNGNVGIGKAAPVVALEVVGDVSATTYNGPGGTQAAPHFTSSDDRTTGLFFPGVNMIGVTAGGTERMRISSGNVGIGTTTPTNALDVSGTLRVIGPLGDLTFTNGTISLAGVPVISSTGVLSNATNTSNRIGGVTLNNTDITYAGKITGSTDNTSNRIGGVTLNNFDVSLSGAGKIVGMASAANVIGGVSLTIGQISNSSYTTSSRFYGGNDGTAADPTYSFSSEQGIGVYRAGTGQLAIATGSQTRFQVSADTTTVSNQLAVTNGTAGAPGYAFTSDAGLGVFRPGANQLALATGGQTRFQVSSATTTVSNQLAVTDGTVSAPAYSFSSDTGLGLFRGGTNQLALATGGQTRFQVSSATTTVSNQLAVTDGTAAAPGYAFTSDAGLGVFRPGTGQLALATSGSNRMTVLASGNVGIGTTAPTQLLDLSGGGIQLKRSAVAGTQNSIILGDTLGTGDGFRFGIGLQGVTSSGNAGCDLAIAAYSDTNTQLPTTNVPWVIVKRSNGFVGIGGVTAPEGGLHINNRSTSTGAANVLMMSTGSINDGAYNEIQFRGKDGNGTVYLSAIQAVDTGTVANPYRSDLRFRTTQAANETYDRMRIMHNGYVGINHTNPRSFLDIDGEGSAFRIAGGTNINHGLLLQGYSNNGSYIRSQAGNLFLGGNGASSLVTMTSARVGIGQTDPQYPLDVTGSARITGGLIFSVQSI
jgi:hypothetical protein